MKMLALGLALIGALGASGSATAHDNDRRGWGGYEWGGHRGQVIDRHRYRPGHRHGHRHRDHHRHPVPRRSRHHRDDRHDHDDVWYGLHLFLGGY